MSELKKDITGREYIFFEEKNIREYECSNLWIKEKVLSFNKYEAAAVEIFNNEVTEYFTFTPQFGRFEEFIDVFDYVEFWLRENEIQRTSVVVIICELSALLYKVDIDTLELGEEIDRISGEDFFTYGYREEEKTFFDQHSHEKFSMNEWGWYEVSDENENYEDMDIDPQF